MIKNVYILTYCQRVESLYGTELIFKTLRTGFPTANVHVFDNASLPSVRHVIRRHAKECGASFIQIDKQLRHHDFIKQTLVKQAYGSAIFIDPDVIFWENVEDWNFDKFLLAGRLLPGVDSSFLGGVFTHPRCHTSFLWIPDVAALLEKISAIQSKYFEFDPFQPIMFNGEGRWQRFDTAGTLYSALPKEQIYVFGEEELNSYDHIFCGTHVGFLKSMLSTNFAEKFVALHEQAKADYTQVRGCWRWQEDYFQVCTT